MPNKLILNSLNRITLVTKGRFTAKHPDLREGVVEVVKAEEDSWYADFWHFINTTSDDDIPEDWELAMSEYYVEKAKKNYPDSEGPFAGPHNSFPIRSQSDVYDAARLVGHAQNPAAVKSKIISIARSKGYSLPKSWTKKVSKAEEILDQIREFLGIEVEKAKSGMHAHTHSHVSHYGYGTYEHQHDHGHQDGVTPDSKDHDISETAHAHAHVSKAGEDVTEEEAKNLQADNDGLKHDLDEEKTAREAAEAAKVEAETARVAAEAKVEEVEKALATLKTEKELAVAKAAEATKAAEEASRQPKTAAPTPVTKAQTDISNMSFDDALKTILHS